MQPITHYPRNGQTYMKGQCGAHSVSSTLNKKQVTCAECKKLIKKRGSSSAA